MVLILEEQIKRINLYLLSLFIFLIIFNVVTFAYSQQSQNNVSAPVQPMKQKDLVDAIFDNSLTSMLMSTFIIAIVGVLITKLRNLKRKLDMIEILTKSQVKMKQQAEEREKRLVKEISDLREEIDRKAEKLEFKIDNVERNATSTLLRYFSDGSADRRK